MPMPLLRSHQDVRRFEKRYEVLSCQSKNPANPDSGTSQPTLLPNLNWFRYFLGQIDAEFLEPA